MRCHFRPFIKFVLLGLATTVAVSWGCAIMVEVTRDEPDQVWSATSDPRWMVDVFRRPGAQRILLRPLFSPSWLTDPRRDGVPLVESTQRMRRQLLHRFGHRPELIPSWGSMATLSADDVFAHNRVLYDDVIIEDARGWPLLAFRCTYGPQLVDGIQIRREVSGGLPTPTILLGKHLRAGEAKALPIVPIWSGVFVDIVAYGTVWTIVHRLPGMLLGVVRRIRRRCPGCGYSVRGSTEPRCPECGRPRRVDKMQQQAH